MSEPVGIKSTDFWVKVVEMLQQNWALIENEPGTAVRVLFVSDASGVFDEMAFPSDFAARQALSRNGFKRFADSPDLQSFLQPPPTPYHRINHPQRRNLFVGPLLAIMKARRRT
jgi:hypothetical protein